MHLLLYLLPQIAVILALGRVLGNGMHRIGQPRVVGEMAAGIFLGPSLLGWIAPAAQAALFPAESLPALNALAQIGLVLFLFLVGLELDPRQLRGQGHAALVTSHASIIAPFLLGSVLALYLYPHLSDTSVEFAHFALFMGAAMSVTAFPVLARILTERNLLSTRLGALAITCAAVDDVTAWGLLAVVIALVRASGAADVVLVFALTAAFVLAVLFGLRPALARLAVYHRTRGGLTQGALAVVFLVVLAAAWSTERIGIHALFGAFLAGVAMPKDRDFVRDVEHRLTDVTTLLLLPLFFAYAGLRTQIGLLDEPRLWLDALLIIAIATLGKFGGSAVAARASGIGWREASALGILMNTRGLMELVILTIGLELGVVSPALFAMMVIMALVTTVMTTPILERIYPARLAREETVEPESAKAFSILVPVALPSSGPELLRVARALAPADRLRVYALHLLRADRPLADAAAPPEPKQSDALRPMLAEADGLDVRPLAFVSRNVGQDVADVARDKHVDLVLLGWHEPVVVRSALGGVVRDVMRRTPSDVAVLLARSFGPWGRVLVPFAGGRHDAAALALAVRLASTAGVEATVLTAGLNPDDAVAASALADAEAAGLTVRRAPPGDPLDAVVAEARAGYGLVVVGASDVWGLEPGLFSIQHERLAREAPASMLVVRAGSGQSAA